MIGIDVCADLAAGACALIRRRSSAIRNSRELNASIRVFHRKDINVHAFWEFWSLSEATVALVQFTICFSKGPIVVVGAVVTFTALIS